jgi:hypothetical protein
MKTLTIGKATLKREAFRAKIGIANSATASQSYKLQEAGKTPFPRAIVQVDEHIAAPQEPDGEKPLPLSATTARKRAFAAAKKARALANRLAQFPAMEIEGTPIDAEFEKAEPHKIAYWQAKIAIELAACFPDQAEATMVFAFRHSPTIKQAFERRLARADVVAALAAVYRETTL